MLKWFRDAKRLFKRMLVTPLFLSDDDNSRNYSSLSSEINRHSGAGSEYELIVHDICSNMRTIENKRYSFEASIASTTMNNSSRRRRLLSQRCQMEAQMQDVDKILYS